jgi:hypothetical protein
MLHYEKRKNNKFFENIQSNKKIQMSMMQNFIPIYSNFFSLNETNYNNINLNHTWYITKIFNKDYHNDNIFSCEFKNISNPEFKMEQKTFVKMAPLLEPYKYLFGKYNNCDVSDLFNLPSLTNENVNNKISDRNNSSYVDSFFCYLSSQLLNKHKILNCVDFFGSFLGLKENYKINIIDDIEYLVESDYFNKNQNKLFQIEDYSHLIYKPKLAPIKITDEEIEVNHEDINSSDSSIFESNITESNMLIITENILELTECNIQLNNENDETSSSTSSSSCSSRTSHSNSNDLNNSDVSSINSNEEDAIDAEIETNSLEENSSINSGSTNSSSSNIEEEMLFVTFNKFPIQLIFLECCDETFDSLILNNDDLPHEEIFSALMQIIMTLLVYQKTFSFTHNDLHTNNVMYVKTSLKFLYYKYKNKFYKVPTFGRIYKIIDFGRAIYKINGQLICSDSFKNGNDASTQYNMEPYFNDKKVRLEPNFSFDLCRLACSMFDYFVDEIDDVKDLSTCDPLIKLITEWCLDDDGINILYKNTGVERYPNFKLYKMIARLVHNHTPDAQLERSEFKKYLISNKKIDVKNGIIINIDDLPSYV